MEESNLVGKYRYDYVNKEEVESTEFNWKADKTFEYCQWESKGDKSSPRACMIGNWKSIGSSETSFSNYLSQLDSTSDKVDRFKDQFLIEITSVEQSSPGRVRMAQGYSLQVDEEGLKILGHLRFWEGESISPKGHWTNGPVEMNLNAEGEAHFQDSDVKYVGTWEEEKNVINVRASFKTESTSYTRQEKGPYFIREGQLVIFDGEDYPIFTQIK